MTRSGDSAVLIQKTSATDGRTDGRTYGRTYGRTESSWHMRAYISCGTSTNKTLRGVLLKNDYRVQHPLCIV